MKECLQFDSRECLEFSSGLNLSDLYSVPNSIFVIIIWRFHQWIERGVLECDDASWQRFREELVKMIRNELNTLTQAKLGGTTLIDGPVTWTGLARLTWLSRVTKIFPFWQNRAFANLITRLHIILAKSFCKLCLRKVWKTLFGMKEITQLGQPGQSMLSAT